MSEFFSGVEDSFWGIIIGIVISIVISAIVPILASTGLIPHGFTWLVHLVIIVVSTIAFIQKIPNWPIFYSLGWIAGVLILAYADLLTPLDIVINLCIPIGYIAYKGYMYFVSR